MPRPPKYDAKKVVEILAEVLEDGYTIESVCEHYGVSAQTFYRWKERYWGIPPEQAAKLRELELENARLSREVKKLEQEKVALEEALEKEW